MRAERKMEAGVRVDISPRPRSPRILTTICRITSVGISETAAANGGRGRGKEKGFLLFFGNITQDYST